MDILRLYDKFDEIVTEYLAPITIMIDELPAVVGHHEVGVHDKDIIRFIFDEHSYKMVGFYAVTIDTEGNQKRIPFEDLPIHKILELAPQAHAFIKSINQ